MLGWDVTIVFDSIKAERDEVCGDGIGEYQRYFFKRNIM